MQNMIGDIWELARGSALLIPSNGQVDNKGHAIMGKGFALEAKKRFPGVEERLGELLIAEKGTPCNFPHYLGQWDGYSLFNFPTKNDWRERSTLDLIKYSADWVVFTIGFRSSTPVYLPHVGCGAGGLDWESEVEPLLQRYFDDRFIAVGMERK